jgi:hypothetical protein
VLPKDGAEHIDFASLEPKSLDLAYVLRTAYDIVSSKIKTNSLL